MQIYTTAESTRGRSIIGWACPCVFTCDHTHVHSRQSSQEACRRHAFELLVVLVRDRSWHLFQLPRDYKSSPGKSPGYKKSLGIDFRHTSRRGGCTFKWWWSTVAVSRLWVMAGYYWLPESGFRDIMRRQKTFLEYFGDLSKTADLQLATGTGCWDRERRGTKKTTSELSDFSFEESLHIYKQWVLREIPRSKNPTWLLVV